MSDTTAETRTPTVRETAPLGAQWPTIDPFLFCAHHDDAYPEGDERLAPAASLDGRDIGMDFAGIDGWNMYHGAVVPGFPQHPHRGFETVTIVRKGLIDHSDSLGAAARFGRGDVQWLTAGRGVVHSEMFPLLDTAAPNPLELFQIWLNLPAADKMTDPYFTMLWDHDIPRVTAPGVDVSVIAGRLGTVDAPPPPPNSWANRPEADVAIWLVRLDAGARNHRHLGENIGRPAGLGVHHMAPNGPAVAHDRHGVGRCGQRCVAQPSSGHEFPAAGWSGDLHQPTARFAGRRAQRDTVPAHIQERAPDTSLPEHSHGTIEPVTDTDPAQIQPGFPIRQ